MNSYRAAKWSVAVMGVLLAVAIVAQLAWAAPPKFEKQDGHVAPVMVEIFFENDSTQQAMLFGFGNRFNYHTHTLRGYSPEGAMVEVWFDSIKSIEEINGDEAMIVMKDDTKRTLRFEEEKSQFYFTTADGAEERIDLPRIKTLRFTTPVRKDRDSNAMFPQWKFSPFTGEKLPIQQ